MDKIKIEYIKTSELKPYGNNPRINDNAVDCVLESIKQFGFTQPIIIDEDKVIVCGHTRLKAALKLGIEQLPCIQRKDLSDEQIKAFRLADNKVSELATWDLPKLDIELDDIEDIDMSKLGFDLGEAEEEPEAAEDDYVEDTTRGNTRNIAVGDVYALGEHRLMCGDSTDEKAVKTLMGGCKADIIFTDPPYNMAFNGRGKFDVIKNDDLNEEDFKKFIRATIKIIKLLKAPNYYIWCNWQFYSLLQENLEFKNCLVWAKNNFGMGNGYRHQHEFCLFNGKIDEEIKNETDLWEEKKDVETIHPTQKPVALCARALNNHKKAKNIVDLFGGSGSTLIACEQLKRKCYMMELDPIYCNVIIDRWEDFTNKKAIKLS